MTSFRVLNPQGSGMLEADSTPLGRGGEGAVYSVESHDASFLPPASQLVVKTYYDPEDNDRQRKVTAMVQSPPQSDSVAWPLAIAGINGKFVGYVMRKLDTKNQKEWLYLAHTKERRAYAPDFSILYALNSCLNLAIAIHSVHSAGHLLGDINESNAFVGIDSSVTIVDTDSAQIKSKEGHVFACGVGKQEFLAPELIGHNLRDVQRTEATEAFAFAVMMFQMLTGGAHPTDGRYVGNGDVPSTASRISQNVYPTLRDESVNGFQRVERIASQAIPLKLRNLLLGILTVPPHERTKFEKIIAVIEEVSKSLTACTVEKNHYYDAREGGCGWCSHAQAGQPDPWGREVAKPAFTQSTLPPLSFNAPAQAPTSAPRTRINGPTRSSPRHNAPVQRSGVNPPQQRRTIQPASQTPPTTISYSPSPRSTPIPPQNLPEKIKGRMTIVYPDGSFGPRPSLRRLASGNPRLMWSAILTEWPDFMKFWWPNHRDAANGLGIVIGLIFSALVVWGSVALAVTLPTYFQLGGSLEVLILSTVALGALVSIVMTFVFLLSSIIGMVKIKNVYGKLDNSNTESIIKTSGRFFFLSLSYIFTLPALAIALFALLWDNRRG